MTALVIPHDHKSLAGAAGQNMAAGSLTPFVVIRGGESFSRISNAGEGDLRLDSQCDLDRDFAECAFMNFLRWDSMAANAQQYGMGIEFIKEFMKVEHTLFTARDVFPIRFAQNRFADILFEELYETTGVPQVVAEKADDIPEAEIRVGSITTHSFGCKMQAKWTDREADQASAGPGLNTIQEKLTQARQGTLRYESDVCWRGRAVPNQPCYGLWDQPNVTRITAAATIEAGTVDQNLALLNSIAHEVPNRTNGQETVDFMAMPVRQLNFLATQKVGADNPSSTTLTWFLNNNRYIRGIVAIPELATIASGNPGIACFRRSMDAIRMNVIQDVIFRAPYRKEAVNGQVCEIRSGGVVVRKPNTVVLVDGI